MSDLMAVNSNEANSIGILGFDGLTVVDLAGPLEALTAARMGADEEKGQACYDVRIIGVNARTFVSESKLTFTARNTLLKAPDLDIRLRPPGHIESSIDLSQFDCAPADRMEELPAWIGAHLDQNPSVEIGGASLPLPSPFHPFF